MEQKYNLKNYFACGFFMGLYALTGPEHIREKASGIRKILEEAHRDLVFAA